MTDPAENFNRLAEHIDGFTPEEAATELPEILGEAKGSDHILSLALIWHRMSSDLQQDPLLGLLQSVEGAMQKVPDAEIKARLGEKALSSISQGMSGDRAKRLGSYEGVRLIAEQVGKLVPDVETEESKEASQWLRISKILTETDFRQATDEEAIPALFEDSMTYLEKAAEATSYLWEHPAEQSSIFTQIAEQSVQTIAMFGDHTAKGKDALPLDLYQRAKAASRNIENKTEQYDERQDIAISMIKAAAKVNDPSSPRIYEALTDSASQAIDLVTFDHETFWIPEAEKTNRLAAFGAYLAEVITEDEPRHSEAQHKQFVEQTVALFKTAQRYAAERPPTAPRYVLPEMTLNAAHKLLKSDLAAAKALMEVGFELAVTEDNMRSPEGEVSGSSRAIGEIRILASNSKSIGVAFKLYTFAHELESGRLAKQARAEASEAQKENANSLLIYMGDRKNLPAAGKQFELDENGRDFVELAIAVSDTKTYPGYAAFLESLSGLLHNYPDLQAIIEEKIAFRVAAYKEEHRPKTENARLSRELLDSLMAAACD